MIINNIVTGELIPDYGWVEYKVNTNTWTTTEWVAYTISAPISSKHITSGHDDNCSVVTSPTYTINQSTGVFSSLKTHYTHVDNRDTVKQIGEWAQYWSESTGQFVPNILLHVSRLVYGGRTYHHWNSDKGYTTDYGDVYYDYAISTRRTTTPHTSISVDWNTIVGVHLTEQTGDQFRKIPII